MAIGKDVNQFVAIVFVLLGTLFGVMIMAFIFGNLTQSTSVILDSQSNTIINETGGFINDTGYALSNNTITGFANPVITNAINATDGLVILSGNFTVSATGVVTNLSEENWNDVNFSYTFNSDTVQQILASGVGNFSLGAIQTYSEQADTQFNTAGIAIVLLILIALFAVFWKFFIGTGKSGGGGGGEGIGTMGGSASGGRRNVASGRGNFG